MSDTLLWPKATDYVWRKGKVSSWDQPDLVPGYLDGAKVDVLCPAGPTTEYAPLQKPKLFRQFVECEPTPDGFRKFAQRHGPLGIAVLRLSQAGNGHGPAGEPYDMPGGDSWLTAFQELWFVAARWDALKAPTVRGQASAPVVSMKSDEGGMVEAARIILAAQAKVLAKHGRRKDLTPKALAESIRQDVSDGVAKYVGAPRVGISYLGRGRARFSQDLRPRTLIGVLWLQCLWEITGEQGYSRCLNCGKWISFSRQRKRGQAGRRPDARFCFGDLCRATWHQNQKRLLRKQSSARTSARTGKERDGKATRKRRR